MASRRIAYLFPGQGAQFVGMGKDVHDAYPEAKDVFERANRVMGFDIRQICFEGPQDTLQRTRYAQAAIFVTSIACLRVFEARFKSGNETVVASAGLSLGEATALVAAGALSFEDGARFVRDRGLFMDEASLERPGGMAAVLGLEVSKIEEAIAGSGVEVANLNGPGQVVISGPKERIPEASKKCVAAGARRCIPLDVSGAFHSSLMDPASRRIEDVLKTLKVSAPVHPVISNLTAEPENDPDKIRWILVRQMNHRTLWDASMRRLAGLGVDRYYEIGPGKVLRGLHRKIDPAVLVSGAGSVEEFEILKGEPSHASS